MFQITFSEYQSMVSQNATPSKKQLGGYLPYVFTEQGVATLSGVLNSKRAIEANILIMRAFVAMRHFLLQNASVFQKFQQIDQKLLDHDENFNKVFQAIEHKKVFPDKGIFFDGQIFDAYTFVSDLVRSADKSIILIDNYVDDSVLTLFSKRKKNVDVTIYTKEISAGLALDIQKYNSQYPLITVKQFADSHDRFMILDEKDAYHFGASLKDLGKKWFAFSKFDTEAFTIFNRLK